VSELRWNPLRGEWVVTATHRQERTFLPPADFCPLCPTRPGGFQTEIPEPTYDIVTFENRFPSLQDEPPAPAVEGTDLYPVEPACGLCEVVVYTPHHSATLADEPVAQIYKLVKVWADRFEELGAKDFARYVLIFENKGEVIGVTLHHPHGQIYAFPFVPPHVARELEQARAHQARTGRCLLCDVLAEERRARSRIVVENESFSAYVPFFARWPYEVHVTSARHLQALTDMTDEEHRDLASVIKMVIVAYDRLFGFSFPYMMVLHQRPTDGGDYGHYHFHVEFYPPLRTAAKLKYLAAVETGGGMFINDTLAEEKAAELRARVTPVSFRAGGGG